MNNAEGGATVAAADEAGHTAAKAALALLEEQVASVHHTLSAYLPYAVLRERVLTAPPGGGGGAGHELVEVSTLDNIKPEGTPCLMMPHGMTRLMFGTTC